MILIITVAFLHVVLSVTRVLESKYAVNNDLFGTIIVGFASGIAWIITVAAAATAFISSDWTMITVIVGANIAGKVLAMRIYNQNDDESKIF